MIDLDDLYLLLFTHWILDEQTYNDEHHRVLVATRLLSVAFFGCRPCSLFDTRVKLDQHLGELYDDLLVADGQIDPNSESDDLDSNAGKDLRGTRAASTAMAVDSERKIICYLFWFQRARVIVYQTYYSILLGSIYTKIVGLI